MAIIPANEKVFMVSNSTNTTYSGSASLKAMNEWYTMQDVIDSVGGGLEGTQYVFVAANGTDLENGAELQAAYVTAQGMTTTADSRITIIAAPGNYNLSSELIMDTNYIDLVSLDGNRSVIFNGIGSIFIDATDVFVKGVDVLLKAFNVPSVSPALKFENCSGGDGSFGYIAMGTYTDCVAGYESFGMYGDASGVFTNCTGSDHSFGTEGTASGVFTDCIGGILSFGSNGEASGSFTNCKGGSDSFGSGGTASGVFTNCTGSDYSFATYGIASGSFTNCIGGSESFGTFGELSGQLYYCRLTSGDFPFTGPGGITRLCIDGNNVENNQG
ncbi:hypothetical protein [Nonlabens sp.]|jgi:hypothetical protein|uniref:hypothetical protein n=1 Tax=Nonlabens sp. TaxID=1888209 RepID=UPI0025D2875E|nr:hypothetical protein [Nonlabens sp.]